MPKAKMHWAIYAVAVIAVIAVVVAIWSATSAAGLYRTLTPVLQTVPKTTAPQTCSAQGGTICSTLSPQQSCRGTWVTATDTGACCKGTCYNTLAGTCRIASFASGQSGNEVCQAQGYSCIWTVERVTRVWFNSMTGTCTGTKAMEETNEFRPCDARLTLGGRTDPCATLLPIGDYYTRHDSATVLCCA